MTQVKDLTEFVKARMNRPVKEYHPDELKKPCLEIIKEFYKGTNTLNVEATILAHQRDELIKAFKGDNKDLTIPEAQMAFEMGIQGKSGPYFGGCYKTYYQFLNYFRRLPERELAWKQILAKNKPAETSNKPLTDWKQTKEGVVNYFNHFKQTGKFEWDGRMAYTIYDILWKDLKLINWTNEERNQISEDAEKEYTEFVNQAMKRNPRKAEEFKLCLVTMATGENRTFINLRKKLALKKYFDQLIKEGRELKDLITNP